MPATATPCPACSTPVPRGARFCTACGFDVSDPAGGTTITLASFPEDDLKRMVQEATSGVYEVERELGRGGMAAVFLATEIDLHRKVAIKVLPPEFTFGQGMTERFQREARTAAQLDHPNIIPIFRVGTAGRLMYFTMKYVEGRSLADILHERGALPIPTVTGVLEAVASALAYAHGRGVIHRDIKPANILIDRQGVVLVSDFGIARASSEATITQSGAVVGTPHYMSPEQCTGKRVGPASDQYSLGVVGFQMLAGRVPFDAQSAIALLQQHVLENPPDLAALRPEAPTELVTIVRRAMHKNPTERHASTEEFADAVEMLRLTAQHAPEGRAQLKALAVGNTISGLKVTPVSGPRKLRKTRPRWVMPATMGVLGAAALTMGTIVMSNQRSANPSPAQVAETTATTETPPSGPQQLDATGESAPSESLTAGAAANEAGREEQQPAPSRPAPPAQGTLVLAGVPPAASVRIDRNPTSSDRMRLDAGRHSVEVDAEGYEPFHQDVLVSSGVTRTLTVTLIPAPREPGTLRISSIPVGDLYIDGQRVGAVPVIDRQIPAGQHRLRIVPPDTSLYAPFDTTITVNPGEAKNLGLIRLKSRGG